MNLPKDLTGTQLSRWRQYLACELEAHPAAAEWLDLWLRASNTLDDLVDRDVDLERAAPCRLTEQLLALVTHPFYRQHEAALGPAVLTALATYRASVSPGAPDKDSSPGVWYLSELGTFVQFLVLMLSVGYTRTAAIACQMRELLEEHPEPKPEPQEASHA